VPHHDSSTIAEGVMSVASLSSAHRVTARVVTFKVQLDGFCYLLDVHRV
jgi:hypothetical protein